MKTGKLTMQVCNIKLMTQFQFNDYNYVGTVTAQADEEKEGGIIVHDNTSILHM